MIKKTVNYVDFNGEEQTEDFYFNLTKAEITEMELEQEGGLTAHIEKITEAKNNKELIALFKHILTKSVGRRSEDGKRFIKTEAIREEFMSSEAYSTIFMELAFDDQAAVEFMTGVIPAGLLEQNKLTLGKVNA